MKLAVCIPLSWEFVPTLFFLSHARLLSPTRLQALEALSVDNTFQLVSRAFPLDVCRNQVVKKALECGADFVVFLYADMTHPPGLLPALARDIIETGVGVVSGHYFKKRPPHPPVSAVHHHPVDPQLMRPIADGDRGLVPCDVVGMGAAIIQREVFEKVRPPWFEYGIYEKTGERSISEDVPFCKKVRDAGFEILTDTRILCGHARMIAIGEGHWIPWRERIKSGKTSGKGDN